MMHRLLFDVRYHSTVDGTVETNEIELNDLLEIYVRENQLQNGIVRISHNGLWCAGQLFVDALMGRYNLPTILGQPMFSKWGHYQIRDIENSEVEVNATMLEEEPNLYNVDASVPVYGTVQTNMSKDIFIVPLTRPYVPIDAVDKLMSESVCMVGVIKIDTVEYDADSDYMQISYGSFNAMITGYSIMRGLINDEESTLYVFAYPTDALGHIVGSPMNICIKFYAPMGQESKALSLQLQPPSNVEQRCIESEFLQNNHLEYNADGVCFIKTEDDDEDDD